MSELKESEWTSGFDITDYDGLFKQPGILHHIQGQQPFHQTWINSREFLYRMLVWHSKLPRLTKDSSDGTLRCTITSGEWFDEAGVLRTVAEKNNVSLSDDDVSYAYYPSTAASSADLVVTTTGFPALTANTPHIRIAKVTVSGGSFDPADITDYRYLNLIQPVFGLQHQIQTRSQIFVGPFVQANIAAGQTNVDLSFGGYTEGVPMPRAGYLVAASVRLTEARSADTATINPTIGGVELAQTGLQLVLDGTSTQTDYATVAYAAHANYLFAAGDLIGMSITTGGSWAPTTSDCICQLFVCFTGA